MILYAIIAKAIPYLIGMIGLLFAGWRVITGVKANVRQKIKLEAADEYQRTIKEMGRVEIDDSPDDAQQWLRERGKR